MTQEQKRDPKISPLYANMSKLKLPPALFNCGTLDPLLDDTVMMSTKWMMSGAESILRIFPGKLEHSPMVSPH
jgi:acetyl esterase/lipase